MTLDARTALWTAVVSALLAGLLAVAPPAGARPESRMTTCPSERGEHAHCVWDGRHMGDGNGPSFVTSATWDHGRFVIRREHVSHKRAHQMVRRILCAEHSWRCGR